MIKTYLFEDDVPEEDRENDYTMEIEFTLSIMKRDGKRVIKEEYNEQRL